MFPVEPSPIGPALDSFDAGVLLGLLAGEGTFGGDGRQPHVVLRMHVRHERLFHWLKARFPYARLYGPYHHSGRDYYQFMWRGTALRYGLMPWLESLPWAEIDGYSLERYRAMKERYGLVDVPPGARRFMGLAGPDITAASPAPPPGGENAAGSAPPFPG
jgi:hypothetical protein